MSPDASSLLLISLLTYQLLAKGRSQTRGNRERGERVGEGVSPRAPCARPPSTDTDSWTCWDAAANVARRTAARRPTVGHGTTTAAQGPRRQERACREGALNPGPGPRSFLRPRPRCGDGCSRRVSQGAADAPGQGPPWHHTSVWATKWGALRGAATLGKRGLSFQQRTPLQTPRDGGEGGGVRPRRQHARHLGTSEQDSVCVRMHLCRQL